MDLAVAIKQEFGVGYLPDHCGYLVHEMVSSLQKPAVWATRRNEQTTEHWKVHQSEQEQHVRVLDLIRKPVKAW